MADLTTQQKKDYARTLYLKDNLTQQEIADKVGVSRQTIIRWVSAEKWEELKAGMTLTREQQVASLHRQVSEINRVISGREEGKRFATAAEADTLNKLATAIKKMETDVGISDIISAGMKFINWLRPFDLDKSKEFLHLWDAFIKDSL
ncbi:helix-turn-helix domain-containing protein [Bacteroides stercoris]|uniref:helix-turn-helix domain-containing protein n=1 Tax=Bacteroides stercoris TaxID=46506 RepID=UPI000E441188|nr:YfeC-like transcriptional regulator [Bacteroides stercoris]RGL91707.1 helix-turn-helix domain-containing protein [Bacteroides stercoris]